AICDPPGKSNRLIMSTSSRAGDFRRLSFARSTRRLRIHVGRLLAAGARARLHFRIVAVAALVLAGLLATACLVVAVAGLVVAHRAPSVPERAGMSGPVGRAGCGEGSGTKCCNSSGRWRRSRARSGVPGRACGCWFGMVEQRFAASVPE